MRACCEPLPRLRTAVARALTVPLRLQAEEKENVMKAIRIHKLVLNISVGESGDRLTKAAKARASAPELAPCSRGLQPGGCHATPRRRHSAGRAVAAFPWPWAALPRCMFAPASNAPLNP